VKKMSEKEYNEEWIEYYQYLEGLRQSGVTNMYGATPYLREEFPEVRNDAQRILGSWMRNYNALLSDGIIER
tara:strand:+ start:558 stop:773 length:216 start_codon:yes stop_codon:yes gene_type:complete